MKSHRAGVLLAATALLFTVVPLRAHAAVGPLCDYGYFCVWVDTNFNGDEVKFKDTDHQLSNKIANQMDNQGSSAWNNGAFSAKLYERKDGKGMWLCMDPNTLIQDLNSSSYDNRASSSKVTKNAACPP